MKRPLVTNVFLAPRGRPSSFLERLDDNKGRKNRPSGMRDLDQEEAGAQAVMRQNLGGNLQGDKGTRYSRLQNTPALVSEEEAPFEIRSSQAY